MRLLCICAAVMGLWSCPTGDLASLVNGLTTPACARGVNIPNGCRDPVCDGDLLALSCTAEGKTLERKVEVPCSSSSILTFESNELFCGLLSACTIFNAEIFSQLLCPDGFYPVVPHPVIGRPVNRSCEPLGPKPRRQFMCREHPATPCENLNQPSYVAKYGSTLRKNVFKAIEDVGISYQEGGVDQGGPSNRGSSTIVSECCRLVEGQKGSVVYQRIFVRVSNRHSLRDLVVACGPNDCAIDYNDVVGYPLNYDGIETCKAATQAAAEESDPG